MTALSISVIALLLGALLAVALRTNPQRVAASLIAQAVATVAALIAVWPALARGLTTSAELAWAYPTESIHLHLDPLSAFFLAWSMPMTLLGSVYATAYLRDDLDGGRNAGPHFALLSLLQLSYLMIYLAQNTMVFLLGWEISAVCAWLLVIWTYRNQSVRFAGFNYLVSTHVGLFFIAAALMTLHAASGSMDFGSFAAALSTPGPTRTAAFLLLGVTFALKSAFFPFHTWLPRAHAAAPAHISALMSGVIHKAGLYGFLRFTLLLGEPEPWMGWTVLSFGAASAIVGALFTTTQRDLKRLLGYSSTENVGIAAMGFGLGYLGLSWHQPALVALGFGGGLLHVFNHALFKCLLFYCAGAVYRATHTVDLERLGGLAKTMPWTAALFLIGGLAISGLPPFNGFASELMLYTGLFQAASEVGGNAGAALIGFAACLAFTGAISALSMVRAFGVVFLGTPRDTTVHASADPGPALLVPMGLHAAGVVLVGLVPAVGLALAGPAAASFGDLSAAWTAAGTATWASAVVTIAVGVPALIGWRAGRQAPRHVTWGCGYTAGTSRMQYTGSSFSHPFASLFEAWMPARVQLRLPDAVFPQRSGSFRSSHPDPIEDRIYEGIARGQALATAVFHRVVDDPRAVFAAGLVGLVLLVVFNGAPA
jgi:hydrogenase-4 component B